MRILEQQPPLTDSAHYINVYIAGCAGGLAFQPIAIPFDYIKVVLQSQIQHDVKGIHDMLINPLVVNPMNMNHEVTGAFRFS